MTIGLKYCGGCNPRYDRAAEIRQIKDHYPSLFFIPAGSDMTYDAALIICGCPSACADYSHVLTRKGHFTLRQKEDLPELYHFLDSLS